MSEKTNYKDSNEINRRSFSAMVALAATASATNISPAAAVPAIVSKKKGCCIAAKTKDHWPGMVDQLKPTWMYTWGLNRPEGLDEKIEFIPMVWGNSTDKKFLPTMDKLKQRAEKEEFKYLLGFNEPDKKSQSNISVEDAIARWPLLMDVGVPLISPACAQPDGKWMDSFMLAAEKKKLRVDAIGFHSYGGASPENFLKRLLKVYRRYGRPIWITEFAVGDWKAKSVEQNRFKVPKIAAFMRAVLPALDQLKFVQRYAWFTAAPSNSALGTSALFKKG